MFQSRHNARQKITKIASGNSFKEQIPDPSSVKTNTKWFIFSRNYSPAPPPRPDCLYLITDKKIAAISHLAQRANPIGTLSFSLFFSANDADADREEKQLTEPGVKLEINRTHKCNENSTHIHPPHPDSRQRLPIG